MTEQGMAVASRFRYSLQACRNLEAICAQLGDRESVRHFQQRQRVLKNQQSQISQRKPK